MTGKSLAQLQAARDALVAPVIAAVRRRTPVRPLLTREQAAAAVEALSGRRLSEPAPSKRQLAEVERLVGLARTMPAARTGALPAPRAR